MTAPHWVVWFGSIGLCLIVATGRIFRPLRAALKRRPATRWLGEQLSCCMCFGFWLGLGTGWSLGYRRPLDLAFAGGAVSLLSYATDLLLLRLGHGVEEEGDPDLDP